MPFHVRSKYGMTALIMPQLTPFGGPLFFPPEKSEKRESRYSFIKKASEDLINQLPDFYYFNIAFHPSVKDWQNWKWKEYAQSTRYTYRTVPGESIETMWENMDTKHRNHITHAESILTIKESKDVALFYEINKATFQKQKITIPYPQSLIEAIFKNVNSDDTCSCHIDIAYEGERPVAAIFTVEDEQTTTNLATGMVENCPRGAVAYLLWERMKKTQQQGKLFDLEGSDLPAVEPFFRSFGLEHTPYFQLYKARNKTFDLLFRLKGKQ